MKHYYLRSSKVKIKIYTAKVCGSNPQKKDKNLLFFCSKVSKQNKKDQQANQLNVSPNNEYEIIIPYSLNNPI